MITLESVASSIYGTKIRIVLRHKGIGALVGEGAPVAVPCAAMPVLVDGERRMTDADAMVDYLDKLRPLPAMLPDRTEAQGRERALSIFLNVRLEPAITALATLVAQDDPRLDEILTGGEAVSATLEAMAKMVDRRGRKRGGNAAPTLRTDAVPLLLGDCGYPAAFAWVDALDDAYDLKITWPGAVRAYAVMLEERAAVAEAMGPCRAAIREWIAMQKG